MMDIQDLYYEINFNNPEWFMFFPRIRSKDDAIIISEPGSDYFFDVSYDKLDANIFYGVFYRRDCGFDYIVDGGFRYDASGKTVGAVAQKIADDVRLVLESVKW
jgi:hypothetical protein